jgi:glutathione reductase (NADPH)
MTQSAFDSIVIGGRSACIAFATTTAAKLGERILMIERAQLGGTCVNRGCLPKKILWSASQPARATQAAASRDIAPRTAIDYRPRLQSVMPTSVMSATPVPKIWTMQGSCLCAVRPQ